MPTITRSQKKTAKGATRPKCTLAKTKSIPLKRGLPKRKVVFQPCIFRGELLVFREGTVSNSIAIFFVHRHTAAAVSEKLGRYRIKLTLNDSKTQPVVLSGFYFLGGTRLTPPPDQKYIHSLIFFLPPNIQWKEFLSVVVFVFMIRTPNPLSLVMYSGLTSWYRGSGLVTSCLWYCTTPRCTSSGGLKAYLFFQRYMVILHRTDMTMENQPFENTILGDFPAIVIRSFSGVFSCEACFKVGSGW